MKINMKTTLKWHNASEKLPKKSGDYLVYTFAWDGTGKIWAVPYSAKKRAFGVKDEDTSRLGEVPVSFWARVKLPKAIEWAGKIRRG